MSISVSESCLHERRYIFAHINVATAATDRWFFYTDHNSSVLTDASSPFGLEPSGTYHMGSSNVSQARQELLQKVVTADGR